MKKKKKHLSPKVNFRWWTGFFVFFISFGMNKNDYFSGCGQIRKTNKHLAKWGFSKITAVKPRLRNEFLQPKMISFQGKPTFDSKNIYWQIKTILLVSFSPTDYTNSCFCNENICSSPTTICVINLGLLFIRITFFLHFQLAESTSGLSVYVSLWLFFGFQKISTFWFSATRDLILFVTGTFNFKNLSWKKYLTFICQLQAKGTTQKVPFQRNQSSVRSTTYDKRQKMLFQ